MDTPSSASSIIAFSRVSAASANPESFLIWYSSLDSRPLTLSMTSWLMRNSSVSSAIASAALLIERDGREVKP